MCTVLRTPSRLYGFYYYYIITAPDPSDTCFFNNNVHEEEIWSDTYVTVSLCHCVRLENERERERGRTRADYRLPACNRVCAPSCYSGVVFGCVWEFGVEE